MELNQTPKTSNVLVVIDTEYIKKNYPNPSQDMANPTVINHLSHFMFIAGFRGIISGQGTADLHFYAHVGDDVSFTGTSIYANSDDAVIVYGIKHHTGDQVFSKFEPNLLTRDRAVMPDPQTQNGTPPLQTKITFAGYKAKVIYSGRKHFHIYIALYTMADDGNTQNLFGYYLWSPAITVLTKGPRSEILHQSQ
jgi:nematocidal protein AidA